MSKLVLLSSVLFLLSNASLTSLPVKARYLATRQDFCGAPQCGQACIVVYATSNCDDDFPSLFTNFAYNFTIIDDTAGVITPFNSTQVNGVPIMSLAYTTPLIDTNCSYIQFSFFDASNQTTGFTYIKPGQIYNSCVSFDGSTAVSYSGVTMLGAVPEKLLEWADYDGNVEEENEA